MKEKMTRQEYMRKWRQAHRAEILEYNRKYVQENPDKKKKWDKKYNEEHEEERRRQRADYIKRNRASVNAYNREWGRKNRDRTAEYIREYRKNNAEKVLANRRDYWSKNNSILLEKQREWREKTGRANRKVASAIKKGQLERKPCEVCGSENAEAHHDDYNKPLDVRWLCPKCHTEWHRNNKPIYLAQTSGCAWNKVAIWY